MALRSPVSFQPLIFLLSLLAVILSGYSGLLLYDGGSDIITRHVVRGTFCSPEHYFTSFGFYLGSSHILKMLYLWKPQTEWFDGYTVVILSLVLYASAMYMKSWSRFQKCIGLLSLIPVILYPEMTKSSTILSFLGGSLLLNHKGKSSWLFGNLLILIAFAIRTEGGFLGLLLSGLFQQAHFLKNTQINPSVIKRYILPCLSWGILNGLIVNWPFTPMDKDYLPLRGYQFALWDFGYEFEQNNSSGLTSGMLVEAGMKHFFADPENINAKKLNEAGVRPKDKTLSSATAYWAEPAILLLKLKTRILQFKWLLLTSLLLLLGWGVSQRNLKMLFIFAISICFFAAFMKLERHLIIPVTICCMLATGDIKIIHSQLKNTIIALMTLPWMLIFITDYNQRYTEAQHMESSLQEWRNYNEDLSLYVDLYTQVKTHIRLFSDPEPVKKWKSFDNAFLFLYPSWQKYMGLQRSEWNFGDILNILNSEAGARFIFHRGKADFFERYAYVMYSKNIKWEMLAFNKKTSTGLYRISQPWSHD